MFAYVCAQVLGLLGVPARTSLYISVPIGVVALRGFTNERSEFLLTALTVVEVGTTPPGGLTVPHFADGGGWTTQVVLVNPGDNAIDGTVQFLERSGQVIQTSS